MTSEAYRESGYIYMIRQGAFPELYYDLQVAMAQAIRRGVSVIDSTTGEILFEGQ